MLHYCLNMLSWSVKTDSTTLIIVVGLIITFVVMMFVVNKWTTPDSLVPKHSYLGDVAGEIDKELKTQTKGRVKASDFEELFNEFKESKIYVKMIHYLINELVEEKPDINEFRKILYVHFLDFRLYLRSVAPKIIDTEIDYCILILAGFKQKHMDKLLNISPSGIRNIKPRLKEKLPGQLYYYLFQKEYSVY